MTVVVAITPFEIMHAAIAGVSRNVSAIRDQRPLENGRTDLGFEQHIIGAIAEYAVAKALNVCWSPAVGRTDTTEGDVQTWQVKTTTRTNGSLIVRPHDPPDFDYILVTTNVASGHINATINGWLPGHQAKTDEWWRERNPQQGIHRAAYFVPQTHLRPIADIR